VGIELAVIGCGNPARRDDGVGVEVIRQLRLRELAREGVELIDAGTSGMDVLFRVRGARRVVIVDACRSGSEPGAVFRLPAREAMTPAEHGFSLHGLRWDHALYAGSRMFGRSFADQAEVILIEAADVDFGFELSPAVAAAAAKVVTMIEPLVRRADGSSGR
jgi:hydrogenase maturation protease